MAVTATVEAVVHLAPAIARSLRDGSPGIEACSCVRRDHVVSPCKDPAIEPLIGCRDHVDVVLRLHFRARPLAESGAMFHLVQSPGNAARQIVGALWLCEESVVQMRDDIPRPADVARG